MAHVASSLPQKTEPLHPHGTFKIPQVPSNRDHEALNRGTWRAAGSQRIGGGRSQEGDSSPGLL